MKKMIALLLSLALALSLAACGKSAPSTTSGQDPADASGSADGEASTFEDDIGEEITVPKGYELKVAFDQDNAPYSYVDESGNLAGIDVDIARAVCEKNEWTLKAQGIDWAKHNEVLSGAEVDCIWGGVSYTEVNSVEAQGFWSIYGGIYVDATVLDDSDIKTLADLKGKRVEAEPGAMFAVEGENATELGRQVAKDAGSLEQVADADTAYQDLAAGKCDAILVSGKSDDSVDFAGFGEDVIFRAVYDKDIYSGSEDSSEAPDESVEANGVCDLELGAGFGEDSDVSAVVSQTMEDMLADGSLEAILQSWSEKDGGAYAEQVNRCAVYRSEELDPSLEGDESIDWDAYEELDLEDLEDLEDGSGEEEEAGEEEIQEEAPEEDNSTVVVQ